MVDTASLKQRQLVCAHWYAHSSPLSVKVLQRERDSQKCQANANISNLCVFPFWDEAAPAAKAGKVRWLLRGVKIDQNRIVLKSKMFFIYEYIIFYIVLAIR